MGAEEFDTPVIGTHSLVHFFIYIGQLPQLVKGTVPEVHKMYSCVNHNIPTTSRVFSMSGRIFTTFTYHSLGNVTLSCLTVSRTFWDQPKVTFHGLSKPLPLWCHRLYRQCTMIATSPTHDEFVLTCMSLPVKRFTFEIIVSYIQDMEWLRLANSKVRDVEKTSAICPITQLTFIMTERDTHKQTHTNQDCLSKI